MKQIYLSVRGNKIFILGFFFISFIQLLFSQDGSLDTSFNPGTGFNNWVRASEIQTDGKILLGGTFTEFNGVEKSYIIRLNNDGTLDNTFNLSNGFSTNSDGLVTTIKIQSDGKIVLGGFFSSFNGSERNNIIRLNSDGSLDTSFNPGTGFFSLVQSLAIQTDGKIIVVGHFTEFNGTKGTNRIVRLNSNGTIDNTFNSGSGFNDWVSFVDIQSDGKIIVSGWFTEFNSVSRNRIARLNNDGTLDTSFNPSSGIAPWAGFSSAAVDCVSIQSNGKLILAGWFSSFNGIERSNICRLNADGSLDTTFMPISGYNDGIITTAIQSDGKIVIGGWFNNFGTVSRNRIARLNTDGSLDDTFNPNLGFNNAVRTISIQNDGKIITGGQFTLFNNETANRIVRLNGSDLSANAELINNCSIYPNPTKDNLYIKNDITIDKIIISTLTGQEIKTILMNSNQINLSLENLPSAIYFIKIYANGVSENYKIIKK